MVDYVWKYNKREDILTIDRKDVEEGDNFYEESLAIGNLIIDFDGNGDIAGLEILDASDVIGEEDNSWKIDEQFGVETSLWKRLKTKINRIKRGFY